MNFLEENLKNWAVFCPDAEALIQTAEPAQPSALSEEEKALFAKKVNFTTFGLIVIYGIGQGEIYEAFKHELKLPNRQIVFIEDDLGVIHNYLKTERAKEMLACPNAWLFYADPLCKSLLRISELFSDKTMLILASPFYENTRKETFQKIESILLFHWNMLHALLAEYQSWGVNYFLNYFQNIFCLPTSYLGNALFGQFQGMPAIICGAGPSLEKNIGVLKTLGKKALIFAGGTAMNALNKLNVTPHFGLGIDPNASLQARTIAYTAFETPFFYRNRIYHDALKLIHSDRLWIGGGGGYDISRFIEEKLDVPPTDLDEGCNVINFSLSIAKAMGCNPIICVGVDLAYSQERSYAAEVVNHPIFGGKQALKTKTREEELIVRSDIYGKPVATLWKWVTESLWYSHFQSNNPRITLINATEGGLGFAGVLNMPLEEVKTRLLTREFDFDQLSFGQIQNSAMDTSPKAILNALEELHASMKRSIPLLEAIRQSIPSFKSASGDILNAAKERIEESLKHEIAYQFLLEGMSHAFDKLNYYDEFCLAIDKIRLSKDELLKKTEAFLDRKMTFILQAGLINGDIIRQIIDFQSQAFPETQEGLAEPLRQSHQEEAGYAFEDELLKIYDSELGLDYEEAFWPRDTEDFIQLNYEDGKLKYAAYRKDGKLHGPSTFFSKEGKVLCLSWYLNGKITGKSWQYHLDGSLRSLQRFIQGNPHGVQEYFYPDGKKRSIIPYDYGLLEGTVELYFPSGRLERELQFKEGLRHGSDRIYNENGLMIVEAFYESDQPAKMARAWHGNGILAQESSYSSEGILLSKKKWTANGESVKPEALDETDYFKQVAEKTDTLTGSIAGLSEQLNLLWPFLSGMEKTDYKESRDLEVANDLVKLSEEIKKLHEINLKLTFESGLDPKNHSEGIWKTPSFEREMKEKVDEMTAHMGKEISQLQDLLMRMLEKKD